MNLNLNPGDRVVTDTGHYGTINVSIRGGTAVNFDEDVPTYVQQANCFDANGKQEYPREGAATRIAPVVLREGQRVVTNTGHFATLHSQSGESFTFAAVYDEGTPWEVTRWDAFMADGRVWDENGLKKDTTILWVKPIGETTATLTLTPEEAQNLTVELLRDKGLRVEVKKQTYSHAFTLAFEIRSHDPQGRDITSEMFEEALSRRVNDLTANDEWYEAVGAPTDSFLEID